MRIALLVEQAGLSTIQDLGRPGYAGVGVSVNGAQDQDAARTANLLVGNAETAALLETTGSSLTVRPEHDVLMAATGAAEGLFVAGHARPAWTPVPVAAGSQVVVPLAGRGFRTYLAVNGGVTAERVLGSVAPDPLLGIERRLSAGDRLCTQSLFRIGRDDPFAGLLRVDGRPSGLAYDRVLATPGPDLHRLAGGVERSYELLPQSDHVGLRLSTDLPLDVRDAGEPLSRGVPIGAVEVPPSGELIILLRGRLVTAGYPVVAVVATHSLDRLAQLRPGDRVDVVLTDVASARAALRSRAVERAALAARVRAAFTSRGLAEALPVA